MISCDRLVSKKRVLSNGTVQPQGLRAASEETPLTPHGLILKGFN